MRSKGKDVELRRYKDILAIRGPSGVTVGFHARNLEIADLDDEAWQALADETRLQTADEVHGELETWHKEISSETSDQVSVRGIRALLLNIAQICNLNCTYCAAVDSDGTRESAGTYGSKVVRIDTQVAEEQIRHFLEAVPDGDAFEIEYCGGEPLLYPQIIESLCRYAELVVAGRNIAVQFSINTNGTLISPSVATLLARYRFHVNISLDGDPTVNDVTRPAKSGRSSTEQTLKGLANLRLVRNELGSLSVNCVFGAHNCGVERTFDFLESLQMNWDRYNFNFANNDSRETSEKSTTVYLDGLSNVAARVFARDGLTGLAKIAQFRRPLSRLAGQTRQHNYCGAGKSLIQSDTRADLYVCNWFMNDPAEKIGRGTDVSPSVLEQYDSSLIQLNRCETCWARHLCGGGCMAVHKSYSGDRHSKDPNFCRRTREVAAYAIWYYKQSLLENAFSAQATEKENA